MAHLEAPLRHPLKVAKVVARSWAAEQVTLTDGLWWMCATTRQNQSGVQQVFWRWASCATVSDRLNNAADCSGVAGQEDHYFQPESRRRNHSTPDSPMNTETIVREKNYGDFVLRLQYVNPNPMEVGSEHEPAIVICRPNRSSVRSAWVIMLSSAWKYVDEDQTHSQYMHLATTKIAEMLHMGRAIETRFRIAEAIIETLEDLINMAPWTGINEPLGTVQGSIGEQTIDVEVH
ncbi:MAG TPA: hypothetical protein VMV39_02400 [Terracidiphilus sp.]|nr:hypothetical protein [Terracidiphilus sp.]